MYSRSPGITTSEATSINYFKNSSDVAYFCGNFEKGEINTPILVRTPLQFKNTFGRATKDNYNDWYQCYNYLQYSDKLYVTRVAKDSMNAYGSYPNIDYPVLILNKEDFDNKFNSLVLLNNNLIKIIARTPGTWGNLLEIAVFTKKEFINNVTVFGTTKAQDIVLSVDDGEYIICVIRNDIIVETFVKHSYEVNDINEESNYIYIKNSLLDYRFIDGNLWFFDGNDFKKYDGNEEYDNGLPILIGEHTLKLHDGSQIVATQEEFINGYSLMNNIDEYEIDIVIGNEIDNNSAINLADTRKDCIAFIGIPMINDMTSVRTYIDSLKKSEYVHVSYNYKQQYDNFSNKNILVNFAGDTAGLKASASNITPWSVGAGLNNGVIKNVIKAYYSTSNDIIDKLYTLGVNTIINNSNGIYLNSQKTFVTDKSSFNRINIRVLFNTIERQIYKIANRYVFEDMREQLINRLKYEINEGLKYVKYSNGIEDYKIQIFNEDDLIIHIYIKPLFVAEFIQMKITNIGTNQFSEYRSA